jgi:hypothetical protein
MLCLLDVFLTGGCPQAGRSCKQSINGAGTPLINHIKNYQSFHLLQPDQFISPNPKEAQ